LETKDLFAEKSKHWDMNSKRVQSAKAIAREIEKSIKLTKEMHLMDFGAGTGLLSYCLSHTIGKVTAIDNSPSMLAFFHEKSEAFSCETAVLELDLVKDNLLKDTMYDGIISSMTLHHIQDIKALFSKFYDALKNDGFMALADLDSEDGTFHSDNEGVFHFGFERGFLEKVAKEVGFKEIKFKTVNTIKKPHATFTVFLMSLYK